MEPGSTELHGRCTRVFITLYFLSTFAVIIMVLERARSESDRLHARLREAERLATAGELAAGMAHEIRNPLAAIVNATALLDRRDGPHRRRARDHAGGDPHRGAAAQPHPLRLPALRAAAGSPAGAGRHPARWSSTSAALIRDDRSRAPPAWTSRWRSIPPCPRFAFDRDQLTQVLWNVALNGVEAMNGRGRLSLEVARQNGDVVARGQRHRPGHLPPSACARVFEPFYSGKPSGSGLGLTIAERIVAAHGGRIEIDSELGRGTRVTLLFPLGGGLSMAHLLVVDDEPSARSTLALLLRKRGHRVLEADGVTAATKRLAEEVFDLVVTDLRMPDGDGLDVLRAVKAHAPATEVILLTAYAEWKSAKEAIRLGALDYFEKGQEPDELNHRIDKALAGRRAAPREREPARPAPRALRPARPDRAVAGHA